MRKSNHICPDSELIERWLVDMVCCVEPYDRGQERPGSERTARKPGNVVGFTGWRVDWGRVIDAGGVRKGRVGLDAVEGGNEGYLDALE